MRSVVWSRAMSSKFSHVSSPWCKCVRLAIVLGCPLPSLSGGRGLPVCRTGRAHTTTTSGRRPGPTRGAPRGRNGPRRRSGVFGCWHDGLAGSPRSAGVVREGEAGLTFPREWSRRFPPVRISVVRELLDQLATEPKATEKPLGRLDPEAGGDVTITDAPEARTRRLCPAGGRTRGWRAD